MAHIEPLRLADDSAFSQKEEESTMIKIQFGR